MRRLHDLITGLLPGEFRRRYRREMRAHFDERRRHELAGEEGSAASPGAATRFWAREFLDLFRTLVREWALAGLRLVRRLPRMLAAAGRDVSYALRILARTPAVTGVMLLTLALGVGANVAIFSVVDAVLLADLPYPDPDRIAVVWADNEDRGIRTWGVSYPNYEDLRDATDSFQTLAAFTDGHVSVLGNDAPERVFSARVSAEIFDVFGVEPSLGRVFTAREDRPGGPEVVVVSERLWRRQLDARSGALGEELVVDGRPHTVVGVVPDELDFVEGIVQRRDGAVPEPVDLYLPLAPFGVGQPRDTIAFAVAGRLAAGVSPAAAEVELDGLLQQLQRQYEAACCGWTARVLTLRDNLVGTARPALLAAQGGVFLVLLLVCVNLAALLTVRAADRSREWSLRRALGAGDGRIVGQLVVENGVLAAAGGALGILVARGALAVLLRVAPASLPRLDEVGLDARTLLFAVAVAALCGVVFGLLPGLAASRRPAGETLGVRAPGLSRRSAWLLRGLVTAEVGVALVLLVTSGLLVQTVRNLGTQDPGYDPEGVLSASMQLPEVGYPDGVSIAAFVDEITTTARSLPGVGQVGAISFAPPGGPSIGFVVEGQVNEEGEPRESSARQAAVSPGYFAAMGIDVVAGRGFSSTDRQGSRPVVVVSESLARRLWPDSSALGRRIRVGSWRAFTRGGGRTPAVTREVVGVVADVRSTGMAGEQARPFLYQPFAQDAWASVTLMLRVDGDPESVAPALRRAVAGIDPTLPLHDVEPQEAILLRRVARQSFSAALMGAFAALALLLAAVGIYGVVSYSVALRTREMGVRLALGASRGGLVRRVLGQGMLPVLAGVGLGLGVSLVLGRFLGSLLYGVGSADPLVLGATMVGLAAVALVATWLPARRAAGLDPATALTRE